MSLPAPRLDDRAFDDIVDEARRRIALYCPEWTDHNLSDPGITLLELFAWMTDIVLYRLNRVPDKNYVKFMELIGMRLKEAEPARVPITFWFTQPQASEVTLPAGSETATPRTETEAAILFSTDGPATVYVPKLTALNTSPGGRPDGRRFTAHKPEEAHLDDYDGLDPFESKPPRSGDALYFGFADNMSNHIIGIDIRVDTAEGAGVDPKNPPYVWEALGAGADQSWIKCEVEADTTMGLNVNGIMRMYLPKMRRAQRNDVNAYWLRLRLEPREGMRSYNISPTIRRLRVESWGITVDSTNVTTIHNRVLGRSDGTPGQRFYLEHSPLITRTSQEHVYLKHEDGREERWSEVSDFATSDPHDRHYTIDGSNGEIRFGPAMPQRDGQIKIYGTIPAKGSMIIMRAYRYGGGKSGNVAANAVSVLKTAISYVQRVGNRVPAFGGMDAENLEEAKLRVPGYLRSLNRAVTASDFEHLTREATRGMVGRAHCLQAPMTNRGEIQVLVIPAIPRMDQYIAPESLNLPSDVREAITAYLDERRLLSTQLSVSAPSYQWVQTEVTFRPIRHANAEDVREQVESKLFSFLNPLSGGPDGTGWPFGRDLYVSDIMAALLTLPDVDSVRSVKLYPVTYAMGNFTRGDEVTEVPVVTHGVIVSYKHDVRLEK
jgi:predicted phage baseplate assembly protein